MIYPNRDSDAKENKAQRYYLRKYITENYNIITIL